MLVSALIGLVAALMVIAAIARWGNGRRRKIVLHVIWGAVFLYPVVFSFLDARSVYNGPDARLVDDSGFGAVNAAWSAFTFLACTALVVGLAVRAREELVARVANRRAVLGGLLLYLGTLAALAIAAGSFSRLLGVCLVAVFLGALTVAGEPLSRVLARVKVASRALVGGSLVAAVVAPQWSFVPYGHGGREFFGIGSRLIGLTPSPNYLGILAVISVYAELAHARQAGRSPNWTWLALGVLTCLWSQSRTAYLLLLILAFFFALSLLKNPSRWSRIRGGTLVVLLATSAVVPLVFSLSSISENEKLQSLLTGRFGAWDAAIKAFSDNPWVGYGPDAFGEEFWLAYGSSTGQTYANGHNSWLDTLASSGTVGALALLAFVGILLRQVLASSIEGGRDVAMAAMVIVIAQMPLGTPFRLHGLSSNLITMAIVMTVVLATNRPAGFHDNVGSEFRELAE